ncbi:MAG: multicopper oxidase domain-containing protein, partial [Hyphomicrobiales bacterium]|nr:multicopper oxidase domain-containing protein [Hyphomicrobiales bacterium]
ESGQLQEESFGSIRARAHAGRLGNVLTLSGMPVGSIPVRSGERIRLRLCSTCNARILQLRFEDLRPRVIALDGQPVTPYPLAHEMIELAPGQRADLLIDMTGAPGSTSAVTEVSQSRLVAGQFIYSAEQKLPSRNTALRLPANNLAVPGSANLKTVDLVMTGGAMGHLEQAFHKGKEFTIRELVREHGLVWAFNGVAGMPDEPLFTAKRGESVSLRMVNDTRWPHAMHFHGHHFRETGGPWRDTLLIGAGKTKTISFVADNPGKWMIHCHMLEHQAGGMATWFAVS